MNEEQNISKNTMYWISKIIGLRASRMCDRDEQHPCQLGKLVSFDHLVSSASIHCVSAELSAEQLS